MRCGAKLTSQLLIAAFGLVSFFVGDVVHAADENIAFSKALDIRVQANGFGRVSSADVTAVLQSAAEEIFRHCPHTQLDGIDVYFRPDHPQMNFKRMPSGRIVIGLSARDTRWAQYSFQFAHEFCHALANFANHSEPRAGDSPNPNLWLEESLCETASLFALRAMRRSWQVAPPYPVWKAYAPWLSDYAEQRLALHRLPAGISFSTWFAQNETALRQNADQRDRNTMIAIQLLPIFEAEPAGWEAVTFLNRGSFSATKSLSQHLAEWRSACPADLRPFVATLAAVFAVKLASLPPSSLVPETTADKTARQVARPRGMIKE
jgi:hypothetical protein